MRNSIYCPFLGIAAVAMLSGCSDDSDREGAVSTTGSDVTADVVITGDVAFGDFPALVRDAAGTDAEACGTLGAGEAVTAVNACLAQAFGNGTDAWAVFDYGGAAPNALRGLPAELGAAQGTVTRDRRVTFYSFDAVNPAGFGEIGSTTTTQCLDPALSGVVDVSGTFACGAVLASSSGGKREDTPATRQLVAPVAWIWDSYRTAVDGGIESLPAGLVYSVGFETNGSYGGLASCIGYGGTWTSRDGTLATEPGDKDAAICDDFDTTGVLFFRTLESDSDSTFAIDDDRLSITSTDGTTLFFSEGDELFPDTN